MNKIIKRWLVRNLLWIILGAILTKISVDIAYCERGYVAYGGEWLVLPLLLLTVYLARRFIEIIVKEFGYKNIKNKSSKNK